jgi:hypothetical protein
MPVPDFSPGEIWTAGAADSIGLWKIAETTFSTTATPFINGCFSADYQHYLVKIFLTASTPSNCFFRVRSGGSTPETGAVYDRYGFRWGTSAIDLVNPNNTAGILLDVGSTANHRSAVTMDIFGPNEANNTIVNTHSWDSNSGSVYFPSYRIETTTAYTGIELTSLAAGTFTGTMRVYGYRN